MIKSTQDLQIGYREYVASKLGTNRELCPLMYVEEACKAAQEIVGDYDLGIELANVLYAKHSNVLLGFYCAIIALVYFLLLIGIFFKNSDKKMLDYSSKFS